MRDCPLPDIVVASFQDPPKHAWLAEGEACRAPLTQASDGQPPVCGAEASRGSLLSLFLPIAGICFLVRRSGTAGQEWTAEPGLRRRLANGYPPTAVRGRYSGRGPLRTASRPSPWTPPETTPGWSGMGQMIVACRGAGITRGAIQARW